MGETMRCPSCGASNALLLYPYGNTAECTACGHKGSMDSFRHAGRRG